MRNANLKGKDLSGQDLSGRDLSGQDLSGFDLSGAILVKTKLDKTIMKNAILLNTNFSVASGISGADLSGARMGMGTDFSGMDLSTTQFGSALSPVQGEVPINLSNAKIPFGVLGKTWRGLNLTGTKIAGLPQDLSRLSAQKCILNNIDFSRRILTGACFRACSLQKAKFVECDLINANLSELTNLEEADFTSANLTFAVLDTANLGTANFKNALLKGCSFNYANMEGTNFEGTDVSTATFSDTPRFSRSINRLTSFKKATLNASMLKKQWSFLDLSEATLLGLDPASDFSNLCAEGAILSGRDFSRYTLNDANFSRASLDDCKFADAKLNRANFRGAKGMNVSFIRANIFNANFSSIGSNGEQPSVFLGVDFREAILTKADFAFAKMGPAPNVIKPKEPCPSRFDGARMEDMGLKEVDLTGAKITSVTLHNSILSGAILKDADLTGVQMGAYAALFSVYQNSEEAKYTYFLAALNSGAVEQIKKIFQERTGADILDKPEVETTAPAYSWTIKDGSAQYIVVKWVAYDKTIALRVSRAATAATLSRADLRDVLLRNADLRKVSAHEVYLYGPNTKLSGAMLDGIKLLRAHMQGIDLSNAKLYGADLTGANLIDADFQRAVLQNATFESAWLQGAKFPDTDLNGVALGGAAVSVHITPSKAGVYLLALEPARFQFELQEELKELSKQYVIEDSDGKLLDSGKLHSLHFTSAAKLTFLPNATVTKDGGAWIIENWSNKYYAWQAEDEKGKPIIYIRAALAPALSKLFKTTLKIKLENHFSIRSLSSSEWELDNDAENSSQEGHVVFRLIQSPAGALAIYATASKMKEKDEHNGAPKLVKETYKATILCGNGASANCDPYSATTVFGPETTCPNARKFRENQQNRVTWLDMLRASS